MRFRGRAVPALVAGLILLAGCGKSGVAPVVSPSKSIVTVTPVTGTPADGTSVVVVSVLVLGSNGSPMSGQFVRLSATGSNNNIVQPGHTNVAGETIGTLATTTAETKVLTVTVQSGSNGIALDMKPQVMFGANPFAVSAANSSAVVSPTFGVPADGTATATITVIVRDTHNLPVAAQFVALSSTGSSNIILAPPVTDAGGQTTSTIRTTTAETKTITVTINPGPDQVVLPAMPSVSFIGDANNISAVTTSVVTAPATGVVANGSDTSTITVTVRDANNNPVAGQVVTVAATGSVNTLSTPANTDVNGQTTATISSTRAEIKTITVTINPGPNQVIAAAAPTVAFISDASNISATLSTAVASPTSGVVANGTATSTVTITVLDVNSNPVSAQVVALASSGTSNTLSTPGATDGSGQTTGTIASTTAETKTITVTINPGPSQVVLSTTPAVTFIGDVANISATSSTAVASPTTVVANGAATSTITVTARDVNNNPLPGQVVTLSATGTGNTVSTPANTDASGQTSGTISATVAGTKTITATINPGGGQVVVSTTPTVTFISDVTNISATNSTAAVSPSSGVVANGTATSTITVTVRDVNNNPIAGQVVSIASTGSGNTLSSPANTNAAGQTTGTIRSTKAETKTITVTVNPGPGQVVISTTPAVTFVGDPSTIHASNSTAVASPTSGVVADGSSTSIVTVTVRDVNNNPVAGQVVALASTGTANTLSTPANTNASGQTTGTIASTNAETKTVTVTINPGGGQVVVSTTPTVTFVGDPANISATNTTAVASPTSGVVANGSTASTITVTVRDINSNAVANQIVSLAASGSNNSVSTPVNTNSSGQTTGTIASTMAETKTITVTINPGGSQVVVSNTPTIQFIGDASNISPTNSTAIASPTSSVVANGSTTSTVTVTVRDVNSNPVAGQVVSLASSGTGNTLSTPANTNASGQTTGTIASTKAETKTVTITVNPGGSPVILSTTPTVGFIGDAANISASNSTVVASPTSGVVADGSAASTITVTVRDANNNAVAGQVVSLASTGTGNTLSTPANTNASGQTTGTIASTVAESKTITVTVNPGGGQVVVSTTPTVGFVGDASSISATNSTAVASPTSGVVADGSATSTITVTARDVNSNPITNQVVSLASTGTGNSLSSPANTNGSGQTSGTIASTKAEMKTVTVTVNPGGGQVVLSVTPTVGFIGDASNISPTNSTAVAVPTTNVVANGTDTSTVTITVRDVNNNPVASQVVSLASSGTGNTLSTPPNTNSGGQTTGTIASTVAETKTITVTINPGASQVLVSSPPTVGFIGDSASISATLSTAVASPTAGVTANGTATSTITVTVRDTGNNPVPSQAVSLASSGTGNTVSTPGSTNGSGQTSGTIASTTAEIKTITVTVNPGGSQVVLTTTPTVSFDPLLDPDDITLVYGEGTVAAPQKRTWDDSASSWSAKAAMVTTSSTIKWVVNDVIASGWYASAWTYRKKITIANTLVSGSSPHQNFPVLISFTDAQLGTNAQTDGDDIVFTAANGNTKLDHEIERYVTGPGQLIAWVKIPALSTTVDTVIYVYYGNGSASNQQAATRVWGNEFAAVWHLKGSYDGTADEVVDSTGKGNDGAAVTAPSQVAAKIGLGQDFETSSSQYLIVDHGGTLDFGGASAVLTFSAWVNREAGAAAWKTILAKNLGATDDYWFGLENVNPTKPNLQLVTDTLSTTTTIGTSQWYHLVATWDHGTMRVYIDGTQDVTTTARSGNITDNTNTVAIGGLVGGGDYMDGMLDEVRIASVNRSADWIASEFANQNNPAAFASVGTQETAASQNGEEIMVALADTGAGTSLDCLRALGGTWAVDWTTTGIAQIHADKRGFDVAYEDASQDILVVYSNNSATPVYRTRNGGSWSGELTVPLNGNGGGPNVNTGVVLWIELASRPGSDEIALAYVDANADLVAIIWEGGQWLTTTGAVLETDVKTNPVGTPLYVKNRAFDLAYEYSSGGLFIAWANGSNLGFRYTTKVAGSTSYSAATAVTTAPAGGFSHYIDVAAERGTDRIAIGAFDMGDGTERLGLAMWDGSALVNAGEYDSQTRDVNNSGTGDFAGCVAWVGTSGTAICVYPDNQTGTLDWAKWTSGAGWVVQTDVVVTGKGFTESVGVRSFRGKNEVMVLLSDSNSDLYGLTYDGTTWTITNSGTALETALSAVDSMPFWFARKRH